MIGDKPLIPKDTATESTVRKRATGQSSQSARQPAITEPMSYTEPQDSGQPDQGHNSQSKCCCENCLKDGQCNLQ